MINYMEIEDRREAFRARTRSVILRELAPHAEAWEQQRSFPPREVFPVLAAEGLLGLEYGTEWGGGGLDHEHTVILAEELGQFAGSDGVANSILVHTDMAISSLGAFGSDDLRRRYLVPALRGEMVAAVGVSEPGHGSDVAGLETTARRDGDEWVLTGRKKWITNGAQAHWISLLARTGDGPGARGLSQFVVPTDTPGFRVVQRLDKLGGRAIDTSELAFDDCRVPLDHLIGAQGRGFQQQMASFDRERMVAVYLAVGEMTGALERTRAYLHEREVYGRRLIESQHIQFRLADLGAQVDLLRRYSHCYADELRRGGDTRRLAAVAKLTAGRLARQVSDTCLQFHGGLGYLDDGWVARYYRDCRQLSIGGGSDEVMLRILARLDGMPDVF